MRVKVKEEKVSGLCNDLVAAYNKQELHLDQLVFDVFHKGVGYAKSSSRIKRLTPEEREAQNLEWEQRERRHIYMTHVLDLVKNIYNAAVDANEHLTNSELVSMADNILKEIEKKAKQIE